MSSIDHAFTLLTTAPPGISEARAARILHDQYGIEGSLKALVSERDQNFQVKLGSGEAYVLKITNSAEAPGVADFQSAALMHVAGKDPDLPLPRVKTTIADETETTVIGDDGRKHTARVLSWLEGIPLRFAETSPDAEQLGALLARLADALEDFEHPASDYVLLWDLSHAAHLCRLLDNVSDEALQEQCRSWLLRFQEYTETALKNMRSQVIYNDLNSSNVLVDPNDPTAITGLIDFGDMVRSPLVVDVAVAAAYLCDDSEDPLSSIVKFLRGYCEVRALQKEEVELLYDLIITRNVMTIIITHWRATQHPENSAYILRNEPRARSTITTLTGLGQRNVTKRFLEACQPNV